MYLMTGLVREIKGLGNRGKLANLKSESFYATHPVSIDDDDASTLHSIFLPPSSSRCFPMAKSIPLPVSNSSLKTTVHESVLHIIWSPSVQTAKQSTQSIVFSKKDKVQHAPSFPFLQCFLQSPKCSITWQLERISFSLLPPPRHP